MKKNIIIVCSEIDFRRNSYYIEISKLICKALQLIGSYVVLGFSEQCFWTNLETAFVFLPFQQTHVLI